MSKKLIDLLSESTDGFSRKDADAAVKRIAKAETEARNALLDLGSAVEEASYHLSATDAKPINDMVNAILKDRDSIRKNTSNAIKLVQKAAR